MDTSKTSAPKNPISLPAPHAHAAIAIPSPDANEGEGNRTAARHYNEAQQAYVASGRSDAAAQRAKEAYDGPEGDALRQAEAVGLAARQVQIEDVTDDAELAPSERQTRVGDEKGSTKA